MRQCRPALLALQALGLMTGGKAAHPIKLVQGVPRRRPRSGLPAIPLVRRPPTMSRPCAPRRDSSRRPSPMPHSRTACSKSVIADGRMSHEIPGLREALDQPHRRELLPARAPNASPNPPPPSIGSGRPTSPTSRSQNGAGSTPRPCSMTSPTTPSPRKLCSLDSFGSSVTQRRGKFCAPPALMVPTLRFVSALDTPLSIAWSRIIRQPQRIHTSLLIVVAVAGAPCVRDQSAHDASKKPRKIAQREHRRDRSSICRSVRKPLSHVIVEVTGA